MRIAGVFGIALTARNVRMQGGEKAAGVKEKLVEMNTIQRFADARNCLEGKIVAVALSLLMALSFLNVSVFADAALAVEGFDGEVGEKTTEPTPPENAPEKASESVSTPTNDGASETPAQKDDGPLDSPTSDGLQNNAAVLTVDTDDVTVELTAAGALPEGARLTVDVAVNDEGKTAMEKALEEGYGLYRIYRLGLVDEAGDPLTLSDMGYRVTVTWNGMFAGEMKAYRIDGPDTVTEITLEKPLTTQGDINPNALTFSTDVLNAPFAFAMPTPSDDGGDKPSGPADPTNPEQSVIPDENTGEGDGDNAENGNGFGKEGDVPGTDNGDTGTGADADVDAPEQPALSEPAANKPVDDSDNEHQLTLYVGEVRDLHRFAASGGTWASENPAVAEVATTGKVTAVAPGDAVVRCGEVTINVTVRPALTEDAEGPQLAYFYFLPPSENGLNGGAAVAAGSDMSGATFLGSGAVSLPSGYDGHSALLNGTVLPLSKDANGNEIRNNYDVQVVPGTFTIGPAGSTVVPPRNPLLPPRSSLGAGMPAGATTPADAIAGVVTTMVGSQRAAAVAEQFGAVAGIILDEDVPMAASVSFDNEEPAVTRVGGEVIEDDATALGAFDEPHCWVHWVMLIGVLLTVGYAAVVVANRLGYARRIDDFNNSLTSTVTTGAEDTRAARVAHKA